MTQKAPLTSRFLKRLVDVGDQICFSALRQWKFDRTLAGAAAQRPTDFTTAVFASNSFSNRIFHKMRDLPQLMSLPWRCVSLNVPDIGIVRGRTRNEKPMGESVAATSSSKRKSAFGIVEQLAE